VSSKNRKYIFTRTYIKEVFQIYQKMLLESQRLEKEMKKIEEEIKKLTKENIISGKNGKYQQWYHSDGHCRKYIPKENTKLVEQLALKKYLSYQLEDLQKEQRAIAFYLKYHKKDVRKAEALLKDEPEYQEVLSNYFQQNSLELQKWMQSPFQRNPQHTENLIHKSGSGNFVRSKSEAIIDTFLYTNHIPFRYECELQLGKNKVYPDFTIRHPKTGKIYYWEHFGLMDNEEYIRKTASKLQLYVLYGIIPTINLITTYETKEQPLGTELVLKLIREYFL